MKNHKKTDDELISLIYEDLLSLRDDSKPNPKSKILSKNKKDSNQKIFNDEQTKNNSLAQIIKNAKENNKVINKDKWKSTDEVDDFLQKIKKSGKSEYDSDVLRETILRRQAQKRTDQNFSNFIDQIKKNKDKFGK